MKKAFVLCALVGVAVYAATAWSAAPPTATEKHLLKDVATLKAQLNTLKKQQTTLTKAVGADELALAGTILFMVCGQELTVDALQGTWQEIDALTAKTTFGPQTPIKATLQGKDICEGGGITRSGGVLPPTIAGFQALLSQFNSNANLLEAVKKHQ
jgi:hypothetical protein